MALLLKSLLFTSYRGYDMPTRIEVEPWWAALTVWGVVNAVNVLQAVGFLSRVHTGSMAINHMLGYVMAALAVPAVVALAAFWRCGSQLAARIGPLVYVVFVALMVAVEYIWPVEFRSPRAMAFSCPISCFSSARSC